MRLSRAHWRRSLATSPAVVLVGIVVLGFSVSPASPQQYQRVTQGVSTSPEDQRDMPTRVNDTHDKVNLHNGPNAVGEPGRNTAEKDDTCLLPPLTLIISPTIAADQLRIGAKARSEYHEACAALKNKKIADAEKHLRKALHHYPKYSAAWVTLGQVLAGQERIHEARSACSQGSIADPSYVPAYLCLADIAARAHAWNEVLKLSGRALELDPASNAVAYEYNAAANLNFHNLATAEKSGLRAVEIDKDHREPRVHFVLAQIYEAKGDSANEAVQLREYLKYSDSTPDAAMVEQYLSNLERRTNTNGDTNTSSSSGVVDSVWSSTRDWAPPDIDARVPPVLSDGPCPLTHILKETSNHTLDLIENMRRFSASERIEQVDIDRSGKRRNSNTQTVNYTAEIEQNSSGSPSIREYRSGVTGIRQPSVMDSGSAVFALIFHPRHVGNFDFRCEGLTDLQGSPAWQVHFVESIDPNESFAAIRIGASINLTRFKGRAWITTDGYNVLRLETDLVSPIPQIDLQLEHQVISYAPVEFQERHIRLWLPQSTSLYIAHHGHRYQRLHNFSEFLLFSVDAVPVIKEGITQFIAHK